MENSITMESVRLHRIFDDKSMRVSLLALAFAIAFVNVILSDSGHFGFWDLVSYLLMLVPLVWLDIRGVMTNRYTRWFIPLIVVLLGDIFYFNNDFMAFLSPMVFLLIMILYLTSMQEVSSFYQTLLPRMAIPLGMSRYFRLYFSDLLAYRAHKSIYNRVVLALVITLPFGALFLALFMAADANFSNFVSTISLFDGRFKYYYLYGTILELLAFLLLFIYGFSNTMRRESVVVWKSLDPLIVGIFLGMLNLLFVTFLLFQLNYLFGGEAYIRAAGINIASFAREGFFQLMWVMGIVASIFLFMMSRYHGERSMAWLLSGLLISTVVIGFASLKKMYLYQSLMGATVLRYYVEWFDYFLIAVLMLGVVFILRRIAYARLLDTVVVIGMASLVIVSSLNVDGMVASHNIEKFKETPEKLDKKALSKLSIDALPVVSGTDIKIDLQHYRSRDCETLSDYHLGYCTKLAVYGSDNINYVREYE